ncbi:MAG: hypothetical protein WC208_13585 [Gallionella sp.]|jgi:hypothetical protein
MTGLEIKFKGSEELRAANRIARAKYRKKNIEILRIDEAKRSQNYRKRNPEVFKNWISSNRERANNYMREWRKKANLPSHWNGGMRSSKNKPAWADDFVIKEIYSLARLRTKITKAPWEIDHVVPLNGKYVCGLHVENNLRIVERFINRSKGNKHG